MNEKLIEKAMILTFGDLKKGHPQERIKAFMDKCIKEEKYEIAAGVQKALDEYNKSHQ
ncbi:MAG: hypothetical protein PHT07_14925 [Paludibacter sp.]|nr:hypothetical protein [Paludibacter sp.]